MRGPIQVVPKLYQLPLGGSCSFLVVDDAVTVIDAGRRGSGRRILECLASLGRSAEEISQIVSTHYHLDHISGIAHLKENSAASVAVHQTEVAFVQGGSPLPSPFQNPALSLLMAPFSWLFRPPSFSVDLSLQDGDRLGPLGGIEVIHTPGHTPGSISLYFRQQGVLIAGDALECRGGKIGLPAPLFTRDMTQAKESIRRLASFDFDVLCFSHFPPIMEGASQALRSFAETLD
jgi:glyoxylase-like metal-dependent hydrolase (beta-lactamase superfamily II)